MSELVEWKTAAANICDAMQERATQVATRASEDLYEHMMMSVQDYLRSNVRFNLSEELRRVSAECARLRASNAGLLAGAKLALDLAEGLINSDYDGTSAHEPMMAELEPIRAAIAKAREAGK